MRYDYLYMKNIINKGNVITGGLVLSVGLFLTYPYKDSIKNEFNYLSNVSFQNVFVGDKPKSKLVQITQELNNSNVNKSEDNYPIVSNANNLKDFLYSKTPQNYINIKEDHIISRKVRNNSNLRNTIISGLNECYGQNYSISTDSKNLNSQISTTLSDILSDKITQPEQTYDYIHSSDFDLNNVKPGLKVNIGCYYGTDDF